MAKQIPVIRKRVIRWAIGVMLGATVAEFGILLYIILCEPETSATLIAWAIAPIACITAVMIFMLKGAFQGYREKEMESSALEAVIKAFADKNS